MSNYLKRSRLARSAVDDFNVYPFSLPLVRSLSTVEFDSQVTFFVGANGAGKSTLLEAIAVALGFNAEGGSRHFDFRLEHPTRTCTLISTLHGVPAPRRGAHPHR